MLCKSKLLSLLLALLLFSHASGQVFHLHGARNASGLYLCHHKNVCEHSSGLYGLSRKFRMVGDEVKKLWCIYETGDEKTCLLHSLQKKQKVESFPVEKWTESSVTLTLVSTKCAASAPERHAEALTIGLTLVQRKAYANGNKPSSEEVMDVRQCVHLLLFPLSRLYDDRLAVGALLGSLDGLDARHFDSNVATILPLCHWAAMEGAWDIAFRCFQRILDGHRLLLGTERPLEQGLVTNATSMLNCWQLSERADMDQCLLVAGVVTHTQLLLLVDLNGRLARQTMARLPHASTAGLAAFSCVLLGIGWEASDHLCSTFASGELSVLGAEAAGTLEKMASVTVRGGLLRRFGAMENTSGLGAQALVVQQVKHILLSSYGDEGQLSVDQVQAVLLALLLAGQPETAGALLCHYFAPQRPAKGRQPPQDALLAAATCIYETAALLAAPAARVRHTTGPVGSRNEGLGWAPLPSADKHLGPKTALLLSSLLQVASPLVLPASSSRAATAQARQLRLSLLRGIGQITTASFNNLSLGKALQQLDPVSSVGSRGLFLLAYQGSLCHSYADSLCADAKVPVAYSSFLRSVYSKWPWQYPLDALSQPENGPRLLKVGFVSSFYRRHPVGRLFGPVIAHLAQRSKFEVHVVQLVNPFASLDDDLTDSLQRDVVEGMGHEGEAPPTDSYWHLYDVRDVTPGDLASKIRSLQLDVVVFPDTFMDSMTAHVLQMRVAPMAVAAWGHPFTAGTRDAIDYFISSRLFEQLPDRAEPYRAEKRSRDYQEQLVLFDTLTFQMYREKGDQQRTAVDAYSLRDLQEISTSVYGSSLWENTDFHEKSHGGERVRVYAILQSIMKMHPVLDDFIAKLLLKDPAAVVLLGYEHQQPLWQRRWQQRLLNATLRHVDEARETPEPEATWDVLKRLWFLPRVQHADYLRMLCAADVSVDPFPFGGGVTLVDALDCDRTAVVSAGALQQVHRLGQGITLALREAPELACSPASAAAGACHGATCACDVNGRIVAAASTALADESADGAADWLRDAAMIDAYVDLSARIARHNADLPSPKSLEARAAIDRVIYGHSRGHTGGGAEHVRTMQRKLQGGAVVQEWEDFLLRIAPDRG